MNPLSDYFVEFIQRARDHGAGSALPFHPLQPVPHILPLASNDFMSGLGSKERWVKKECCLVFVACVFMVAITHNTTGGR